MKGKLTVKLDLEERAYSIMIGRDLSPDLRTLARKLPSKNAFVISDRSLIGARAQFLRQLKKAGYKVKEIPVKAGEGLKDFKNTFRIYGDLLRGGAHRDCVIFALGGGSVGDAAGFIASTYLRGVAWVGVPTTLLAQVDSAIGGKTAVNHPQGKNLIGTFHQPVAVLCDVIFLKTLGRREVISGLGEALKYGLTYDLSFYRYVCANWQRAVALDEKIITTIIHRCVQFKAGAVVRDEFDRRGVREVLNFGHTMGHALEKATSYKVFQHGEAVLWGMRYALALSEVRRWLSPDVRADIETFFREVELPPWPRAVGFAKIVSFLSKDKKIRNGKLHYVLLKDVAKPVSDSGVTKRDLSKAFALLVREKVL